jgi:tetratricopeptide (TPR) repeat protein
VRRAFLLGLVAMLVAGCQQAPPPPAARAPEEKPRAVVLREEGDALAAKGDHAGAAEKYRAALELEPEDVGLHYALGTSFTHLDRRPDAIREYRFVVARGKADSDEVRAARQWLISVGALAQDEGTRPDTAGDPAAKKKQSSVKGKLEWPGVVAGEGSVPIRLMLNGDDGTNRGFKQVRFAKLANPYEFSDVPPGSYRLIGVAIRQDQTQVWDVRLNVEPGKDTVVDLTNANGTASADLFTRERR